MSSTIHQYIDEIVGVSNQFWGCPKRRRDQYHSPNLCLEGGVCLLQYPYSMFRLCGGKVIPFHLPPHRKLKNSRVNLTSLHNNSAEHCRIDWVQLICNNKVCIHVFLFPVSIFTCMNCAVFDWPNLPGSGITMHEHLKVVFICEDENNILSLPSSHSVIFLLIPIIGHDFFMSLTPPLPHVSCISLNLALHSPYCTHRSHVWTRFSSQYPALPIVSPMGVELRD